MAGLSRICAAVTAAWLFVLLPAGASVAQQPGALSVEAPWARASAGAAKAGAAYLRIVNAGTGDDRLVGLSSPVAARVELHTHIMQDGVMRMRRIDRLPVPANKAAELKPGGHHAMLIGLGAPLKEGGRFPLTLTFEKAGTITVQVAVGSVAARGPAMKHHDHK